MGSIGKRTETNHIVAPTEVNYPAVSSTMKPSTSRLISIALFNSALLLSLTSVLAENPEKINCVNVGSLRCQTDKKGMVFVDIPVDNPPSGNEIKKQCEAHEKQFFEGKDVDVEVMDLSGKGKLLPGG